MNTVRWSRAVKVRYVTHADECIWVRDIHGTPVQVKLELKSMDLDLFGSGDWKQRKPPSVYITTYRKNYTSPTSNSWKHVVGHGETAIKIGDVELGQEATREVMRLKAELEAIEVKPSIFTFQRKTQRKKVVTPTPAMRVIKGNKKTR